MKKFTLLCTALLMVSFIALAQIKMIVYLNDAESIEVYASSVDSITFTNFPVEPDEEDKPSDKENPDEDEFSIPVVETPGNGKTTIALYIPESSCEEAEPYILGVLPSGETWINEDYNKMEFLGKNWWKITVDALTPENATNIAFRMESVEGDWRYSPQIDYELLGDAYQYLQNTKANTIYNNIFSLKAIADCDNQVLYLKSDKWSTPCSIFEAVISDPTGYEDGYGYVDLGLPSGTMWATMNIGANSPEDFGDYFAWGEIEPKSEYNWSTYKWMTEGKSSLEGVNKYTSADGQIDGVWYNSNGEFIGDNKIALDLEDDVANVNWGGNWRVPTKENIDELYSKCTWTWTEKDGVYGYTVTGPNGNSIFLPAAGFCQSPDSGRISGVGSYGKYWSNSLGLKNSSSAFCFSFSWYTLVNFDDVRSGGASVRSILPDTLVTPSDSSSVAKPFSVSATKTVTFSPGNLQYHAVNDEWRFAPSQLDYVGEDNSNISPNYNGWIDLFGWGTGTNPTNISKDNADYQTFVDWGVNKIGTDAPNTWRTLTDYEWSYLIKYRPNASNLVGVAEVDGVNGLIFLPDAWVCPEGLIFKPGFHDNYGIKNYGEHQTISASDWSKLEANGAVFLPTAGIRYYGSGVSDVQYSADYWSATDIDFDNAFYLSFDSDEVYVGSYNRYGGRSVRLVQD